MCLRKKGFTLIELLVVIAILGLLIAILLPALAKVKDQGRALVCRTVLKTFGAANFLYAADWRDNFVPFSQPSTNSWSEKWPQNKDFRNMLDLDGRTEVNDEWDDPYKFPEEHLCPSMPRITDAEMSDILALWGWEMRNSYAYNCEWWENDGFFPDPTDGIYRGHKLTQIQQPSDKMMFIDGNFYQTRRARADYETWWDVYGEDLLAAGGNNFGQVAYRHSEGANMVFFDGHTDKMDKEEIYDIENPSILGSPLSREIDTLWDVRGTLPPRSL